MFMAIVVEAYVGANLCKEARVTEDDLAKSNPMVMILYTNYHKLRNLSLLNDDEALPEEQSIALRELPGIVVRKWLEKERRMQLLVDRTLGDVSEEEAKRMLGRMHDPVGASDRKRKKKPFGLLMTEFRQSCQRCLSLPSRKSRSRVYDCIYRWTLRRKSNCPSSRRSSTRSPPSRFSWGPRTQSTSSVTSRLASRLGWIRMLRLRIPTRWRRSPKCRKEFSRR